MAKLPNTHFAFIDGFIPTNEVQNEVRDLPDFSHPSVYYPRPSPQPDYAQYGNYWSNIWPIDENPNNNMTVEVESLNTVQGT